MMKVARAVFLAGIVIGLGACTMPTEERFSRHFESASWSEAFSGHVTSWETQGVPELLGLAYLPYVRSKDDFYADEFRENLVVSEKLGLNIAYGLEFAALGMGFYDLFHGDEGAMIETWIEAETLNHVLNTTLKNVRGRERPNGSNDKSFPSGAAQSAFLGATLGARWIEDQGNDWYYKLGYGLYIPATLAAHSRVEHGKHWYSDVVAGAVLGMIVGNTIYNLHFGDSKSGRGGIFPRSWANRVSLEPGILESGIGISLTVRF